MIEPVPPLLDEKVDRRSRKHLLQLLDDRHYTDRMNALLRCNGATYGVVSESDARQPAGTHSRDEWEIPRFCETRCPDLVDSAELKHWWLPPQPTTPKGPTWDLLSTCKIKGERGLLLVEAKAHEQELGRAGKSPPSGSAQSATNHEHIRGRLSSVSAELRSQNWKVDVNAEKHYQLANRVAWAWKLSECGVPVILLYLGFLGDTYFSDRFIDRDHWQRAMGSYMEGVVPLNLPGQEIAGRSGG